MSLSSSQTPSFSSENYSFNLVLQTLKAMKKLNITQYDFVSAQIETTASRDHIKSLCHELQKLSKEIFSLFKEAAQDDANVPIRNRGMQQACDEYDNAERDLLARQLKAMSVRPEDIVICSEEHRQLLEDTAKDFLKLNARVNKATDRLVEWRSSEQLVKDRLEKLGRLVSVVQPDLRTKATESYESFENWAAEEKRLFVEIWNEMERLKEVIIELVLESVRRK